MRWVILADDWPPLAGGVATWGYGAARALAEAGHEVMVFARKRMDLSVPPGVRVIGVPGPSFGRRGHWWLAMRGVAALRRADAVLATTWTVAAAVATPLAAKGIPLHVVFHGSDLTRKPFDPEAFEQVLDAASHRWAVSRYLVSVAAKRGVEAEWIASPVEALPPRRAPVDGPWGLIARATPLKGGERFIRLVAEAGVEGVVVGDGLELGGWVQLAKDLSVPIRFTGPVRREAVYREIEGWSLSALLPRLDEDGSRGEGLGIALLETAARSVPVVGCRTGGVPEAVGPGLIVEDPDDPAAMVAEIRAWLGDSRGEAGRAYIEQTHGRARLAEALLS